MCEYSEWLRNEGREEATLEIAKALKEKGFDISMILEVTGLEQAKVAAL